MRIQPIYALILIVVVVFTRDAKAGLFSQSDFCECVLTDITGIENDVSAWSAWQSC
jgi:hypothetical protein